MKLSDKRTRIRPLPRAPRVLFFDSTWGLRPRLYAAARFAGSASDRVVQRRMITG